MMSDPFDPGSVSDELLSAYLDGELSPKQVAQIEQWVSESPDARRRLEDFRRISGWIQELPRAELPSEFASQVLREAERQMLLPAPAPRPTFARRLRWWTLAVAAPLSAAAALFVTILLSPPPEGPAPELARREAGQNATENRAVAARSAPPAEADASHSGFAAAPASPAASAADSSVAARVATAHEPAAAADSYPADLARPAPVAAPSNLEDLAADNKPLAPQAEEIGAAEITSLVRRAREINDQGRTAVVRLYVIDRREGMELVQVVLDENQIQRDAPPPPALVDEAARKPEELARTPRAAASRARASGLRTATPPTGHEGLFVVADVEKLTAALESLRTRQESAVTWTLADSIDFDALDRPSRQRVNQALLAINATSPTARMLKSKANGGEAGIADKPDLLAEKSDAAVAARAGSKPETGRPAAGLAAVPFAKGKSVEPSPQARQVLVTVATTPPESVPETNAATKPDVARSEGRGRKPGIAPEAGAKAQNEKSAPTALNPGLVRLILLVESKSLPER